ncbi:MAG: hypothetical protein K9J13_16210, partial [Saprospiraceae bacterium]|nr:hypothetical protein [Saprospiraceae bacterium]
TLKNKDHGKNVNYKIGMILYGKFIQYLKSCAVKNSVLVIDVNPAYTSIIGKFKYADKLGRCVHQCASYVIARRGNRHKEKVPSRLGSLLQSGEKVNHHWSQWNKLNKRITTVLNKDTLHEFFKNLGKCTHDSNALILN